MDIRKPLSLLVALTLAFALAPLAACGDNAVTLAFDAGGDGSEADATGSDASSDAAGDAGQGDAADSGSDALPKDTIPPAQITLTATTSGVTSITLSWTAVGDDGTTGTAKAYDVRQSATAITSLAEFTAATVVASPPVPAVAGTVQTKVVTGLAANTAYHFAIRAHDEVPNQGPISADATATTFARAQLQISEVAVSNGAAQGYDFVELVALTAGHVDGLVVREASASLYTFGALTVVAGDRFVVHAAGTPCPTGCAQEDVSADKTSSTEPFASATVWDVYATPTSAGLSAADNVISVLDGASIVDAVALSNRDGLVSAANMTAFAALGTAGGWTFGTPPVAGTTDCATQKDAVSIATGATACGGQPSSAAGVSVQRNGTTDTNQRKDFYVAPQTMGAANGPNPAPAVVSAVPSSATGVLVTFSEDLDAASITVAAFAAGGLVISAASLSDVNQALLVTDAQVAGQGYTLSVAMSVTDLQGTALVPASLGFCGYSATPVALVINEVAPSVSYTSNQADLIELRVVSGGAMAGIVLRANASAVATGGTLLATLPDACVPSGDLIVVHLHAANAPGPAPASELTAKNQYPSATYAANYDGAWDFVGGNNDLVSSETVLTVVAPPVAGGSATYLDAVAFSSQTAASCVPATCTTSAAYKTALGAIEAATEWTPACSGAAGCDDVTLPNTAVVVSAGYAGVGSVPTGNTVARDAAGTDTNAAADWAVGASTLGAPN